jgi:glycosyltransferase involved in cell wall biosynthesis
MTNSTGYVLVVARARDDAFTALFFESLPPYVRQRVRIREFGSDSLITALAGATAVVLTRRGLFDFRSLSAVAGRLGIPRYYFLDDNFLIVREEAALFGPGWSAYTADNVRRALDGYSGVLLGSRPLMEYFADERLHPRLVEYPPIAWPVLRSRTRANRDEPFRIAFFGGDHRKQLFVECVYPAVQRLARERAVELVFAGVPPSTMTGDAALRIVMLPYEHAYGEALRRLAECRVDALVHPTPSSRNNRYKNANVLINARAVGAVPVLSDELPYSNLEEPLPALLCENSVHSWHEALWHLASDRCFADQLFDRTANYCARHFSGEQNARTVRDILNGHAQPGRPSRLCRAVAAAVPLEFDRACARARRRAQGSAILRAAVRPFRRPAA